MKRTCAQCPYSRTKTLWLSPTRALEFALQALNPGVDFPCHKTAEVDDETGDFTAGARSKTCHGFKTLRNASVGPPDVDPTFIPDGDGFTTVQQMIDGHAACRATYERPDNADQD